MKTKKVASVYTGKFENNKKNGYGELKFGKR